jgi:hypothetical protein
VPKGALLVLQTQVMLPLKGLLLVVVLPALPGGLMLQLDSQVLYSHILDSHLSKERESKRAKQN